MASNFCEFMSKGDTQARALLGQPATFAVGVLSYGTANVILAPAMEQMAFTPGGAELTIKCVATVRKDSLPQAPQQGDSVNVDGTRYYITAVEAPACSPILRLTLAN
jgi:hypothetical protein